MNALYNYLNYLALTISRLLHHRNLPTDRLEGKTESGKMLKKFPWKTTGEERENSQGENYSPMTNCFEVKYIKFKKNGVTVRS